MDPLPPGALFDGRYRVLTLAAQSAESAVYQARLEPDGGVVCLRTLHAAHLRDAAWQGHLRGEMEAARRLQHPNVAALYDQGVSDTGTLYAVSEWLDGPTLEGRLAHGGALGDDEAEGLLRAILSGLTEAHAIGLVHRDVKPGNLFLVNGPDGETVKISELGMSLARGVGPRHGPCAPSPGMGTPGYLAPEVLRGAPATPQADLYALGIVGIEMLSGQPAFPTTGLAAIVATDEPTVPEHVFSSSIFTGFLAQLVAQDAFRRPSSAEQALRELTALRATPAPATQPLGQVSGQGAVGSEVGGAEVGGAPVTAPRSLAPSAPGVPAARPRAHRAQRPLWPWVVAALAFLIIAGGALGAYFWLGGANVSPREGLDDDGQSEADDDGAASASSYGASGDDAVAPLANAVVAVPAGPGGQGSSATGAPAQPGAASTGSTGSDDPKSAAATAKPDDGDPDDGSGVASDAADTAAVAPTGTDGTQQGNGLAAAVATAANTATGASPTGARPVPAALSVVEPGDPMYGPCATRDMDQRCFVQLVPENSVLTFSETDLDLSGSALVIVERHHPFELLAVGGAIQVTVPPGYLWARFAVTTKDDQIHELLLYSDRALARKTLAAYERDVKARWADAGPQDRLLPFFAELAELTGDRVAEVVVQGRPTRQDPAMRMALTLVMSADGRDVIDAIEATYPQVAVRTLAFSDAGPMALIANGEPGCDITGHYTLWRYDRGARATIFDTRALAAVRGLPERYLDAGSARRLLVIEEAHEIKRIELYADEDTCMAGEDGYALVWR